MLSRAIACSPGTVPHTASMISRRQFRDFFAGRADRYLVIATLNSSIGVYISAQTTDVRMERSYALKMLTKHRLTYEHLHIVQKALDRGHCFAGKNPNHLEFVYFDDDASKTAYLCVIKTARYGQEVWFVSLFRVRDSQPAAMKRKQRLLREATETK
jgi:hypothetical protein